jgi:hypothetical protein
MYLSGNCGHNASKRRRAIARRSSSAIGFIVDSHPGDSCYFQAEPSIRKKLS